LEDEVLLILEAISHAMFSSYGAKNFNDTVLKDIALAYPIHLHLLSMQLPVNSLLPTLCPGS